MAELSIRRSALEAVYSEGIFGASHPEGPRLILSERRPLGLVNIGGNAEDAIFKDSLKQVFGCNLPALSNTVGKGENLRILWLAPKRWLIASDLPETAHLAQNLKNAAITDVSNGRTVIRLQGPQVRSVLAKGCPLDLHQKVFTPGHCAQSRIASLNVLLDAISEDTIDVYVARGFGLVFWEWLLEASAEYGYRINKS